MRRVDINSDGLLIFKKLNRLRPYYGVLLDLRLRKEIHRDGALYATIVVDLDGANYYRYKNNVYAGPNKIMEIING